MLNTHSQGLILFLRSVGNTVINLQIATNTAAIGELFPK